MAARTSPPTVLLLSISTCLLAACGGGGGAVRADTPPPSLAPPPVPCSPPLTADCVVADVAGATDQQMTGGRQSDHRLIKRGGGTLTLISQPNTFGPPVVDYRFSGGTTIEDGRLRVASSASLHSDVLVQTGGRLELFGTMTGNATNHGGMYLWDTVVGDVTNDGVLTPGAYNGNDLVVPARIQGDFSQTAAGTLEAVIGAVSGGFVWVTGRADIAGTLRLVAYTDAWGPYPLPVAPFSLTVLHADGGVFGQFSGWTSPGLFLTGNLRYLSNDIFFDATSLSAAQVMSAAGAGDALTLGAAGNFDRALGSAGGFTGLPRDGLSDTQRRFLASAAVIQRVQDYDQAIRTFDSLSGHGHAAAVNALLQQAALPAPGLIAHLGRLHAGSTSGPWSAQAAVASGDAGMFSDTHAGYDQWLSDRVLLGSSFGWSQGSLQFDRSGGRALDRSPQWDVYLRRNGDADTYVLGNVGYGHHQLGFDRQIDLGIGRQRAHAERSLDVMHAYAEAGRDFRVGQGRMTPFAALSYAALRGAGFTEQGNTGFELIAQPAFHQRTSAAAGLRFGQDWRRGGGRWTQLNLAAGYRQLLDQRDDARAAFTGTPDVQFALAGLPPGNGSGWLQLNLGTGGQHWAWLLNYDRQAGDQAVSLGAQLKF